MNMIRELRKKAGLTQASLARELGVKRETVAQWERGENKPRAATLLKLADYFHCTVDSLLRP